LAAAQLVEGELVWKAEESRRRERLDEAERMYEAEKKWREMEKSKGKKRKADEDDEMDEGSGKKRKEVSNKSSIGRRHTNESIAGSGGRKDHHSHGGPLPVVRGHTGHLLQEDSESWLLGMQQAQDEVQRGCASGGRKEWREERRRVGGAATTNNANHRRGGDGVVEEVGGSVGEGSGGSGSDGESLSEDGRAGEGVQEDGQAGMGGKGGRVGGR